LDPWESKRLGRADSQIKSRGYRIEPGEIETALNALGLLRECAIVAVDAGGFEGVTICCAYAPLPGHDSNPTTLRQALSKALPSYMLPSRWKSFERLPQNGNGKIDRRALREQFQQSLSQPTQIGTEKTGPNHEETKSAKKDKG